MAKPKNPVNRRGFLKGAAASAAAGAAALAAPAVSPSAASPSPLEPLRSAAPGLTPQQAAQTLAVETAPLPAEHDIYTVEDAGSDFMVDVLKTLDFDYIAANPASSFRGLHESLINYGRNKSPEWIT